jgi:dephospho-CoA kinase
MAAQMTDDQKAESADFILENNGSIPDLLARVEERLAQHEKTQKN